MKILITGATGFVGKRLTQNLLEMGHDINILTRDKSKAQEIFKNPKVQVFEWRNNLELPPLDSIVGIDGVINLMGENIASKRWSSDQKLRLRQSRIDATKNIISLIEKNIQKPLDFFISSSAIGIYPVNRNSNLDETSTLGHGYLATLCKDWEEATESLVKVKRKVIIRTGVVLEKTDGALKKMLPPFLLGAGGPVGSGDQFMSWIHLDDLVQIFIEATKNENFIGIINGVAPLPVDNFTFTKSLGKAIKRPTLFPVPEIALKLAFGEMSSVILDSQKISSKRLNELNFKFKYEKIDDALGAIFKN